MLRPTTPLALLTTPASKVDGLWLLLLAAVLLLSWQNKTGVAAGSIAAADLANRLAALLLLGSQKGMAGQLVLLVLIIIVPGCLPSCCHISLHQSSIQNLQLLRQRAALACSSSSSSSTHVSACVCMVVGTGNQLKCILYVCVKSVDVSARLRTPPPPKTPSCPPPTRQHNSAAAYHSWARPALGA